MIGKPKQRTVQAGKSLQTEASTLNSQGQAEARGRVVFAKKFGSLPVVLATPHCHPADHVTLAVTDIGPDGFEYRLLRHDKAEVWGAAVEIGWYAFELADAAAADKD